MNETEFVPMDTTASVLWSGENPKPCTSTSPFIQWAQVARLQVAQADDTQQLVIDRVGDRKGVGKLLCFNQFN